MPLLIRKKKIKTTEKRHQTVIHPPAGKSFGIENGLEMVKVVAVNCHHLKYYKSTVSIYPAIPILFGEIHTLLV